MDSKGMIQFDENWEQIYVGKGNIIGLLISHNKKNQMIPEELIKLLNSTWGDNWKEYCNCIDNRILKKEITIHAEDFIDLIEMLQVKEIINNEKWKELLIKKFKLTKVLLVDVKQLKEEQFNNLKIMILFLKKPKLVILFEDNIIMLFSQQYIQRFLQEYENSVIVIGKEEGYLQKICGVIYRYGKGEKKNEKICSDYERR